MLFHQASFAASLGLGAAILLLILGTQILNWYWPVLLFAGCLAVGAYRSRSKFPSQYQVAQSIDRELGFHDSLSTAIFFAEHPGRPDVSREFLEGQRNAAENLARSADVERGLPFLTPRTLYVNAALAAIVVSMFGVRYGINHNLDLRPSLVRIGFDGFLGSSREIADAKRRTDRPFDKNGRDKSLAADPWEAKAEDPLATPDAALDAANEPEVANPDAAPDGGAKSKATGADQPPAGEDPIDSPDKGENSQAGSDSGDSNSPEGNSQGDKQESSMKNSGQSGSAGENSSLSEKMRDALANLLSKLKPNKNDSKPGNNSQAQNGSQSNQQKSQSTESNSQSANKQQADGDASAQSQGDQQSQNGSQQSAQGKSEGKSSDKPNSPDGKSGIGKQDGDKSAREAAELAAMGKLSEIIGKRAANVSGEVMVEVASGKQQLKTQYTQKSAAHTEAGSEINRDEVPLAYQQYVQQYFEEVRKLPGKAKPKGSGN